MAKSKRNKIVSLTKTKKINVSDKKLDLVEKIQKYMDNYNYCYSFYYKNMTTMPMQELRNFFSDSKFRLVKDFSIDKKAFVIFIWIYFTSKILLYQYAKLVKQIV